MKQPAADCSRIKDFINSRDLYAVHNGIQVSEIGPGYATAQMTMADHMRNGLGMLHGGALFGLADVAFAAASNSHGTMAVGISASMTFVKAAKGGTIRAEARETSLNHKLATYAITVTDEAGETLATFQGMVYRKKERIELPGDTPAP